MAEPQDNDVSSYSDPIYDRLEGVKRFLANNWLLLAIIVLSVVVVITALNNMDTNTPESRSATAYNDARGDKEKLKALTANSDMVATFRFKAANDLFQMALDDKDLDQARQYLSTVEEQARASQSSELKLYAAISRASFQHQAGELEAALQTYEEALRSSTAVKEVKAGRYLAQFNQAQVQIAYAASLEDQEQAMQLRERARDTLDQLRVDITLENSGSRLQQAAEYSYWNLLRAFPSLAQDSLEALPE